MRTTRGVAAIHTWPAIAILSAITGVVPTALLSGCAAPPKPGDPLPGLTAEERARFERGKAVFEREFEPANGLGPLFNANACRECHEESASGGPGDEVEIHATAARADGTCDPLLEQGGPVVQQHVTGALHQALGINEEPVPAHATATGRRTTPDILGFGLLDAIPDEEILSRADPEDRNADGISGRPNRSTDGRLGRFGRKAFVPTLREFNEEAFLIEQGVTTPAAPREETVAGRPLPEGTDPASDPEIDEEAVALADFFVRALAPPASLPLPWSALRGRRIFRAIGCVGCHVPVLMTGASPQRTLRYRPVAAYTDLLLHDMGADLADLCLGLATPSEFRTEPLMGLRLSTRFLHDGRTATVEKAIILHGGEAERSRERFMALSDKNRRALLEFLSSL
jgi:CxxC motif-containing protein (DUF1111 family)